MTRRACVRTSARSGCAEGGESRVVQQLEHTAGIGLSSSGWANGYTPASRRRARRLINATQHAMPMDGTNPSPSLQRPDTPPPRTRARHAPVAVRVPHGHEPRLERVPVDVGDEPAGQVGVATHRRRCSSHSARVVAREAPTAATSAVAGTVRLVSGPFPARWLAVRLVGGGRFPRSQLPARSLRRIHPTPRLPTRAPDSQPLNPFRCTHPWYCH